MNSQKLPTKVYLIHISINGKLRSQRNQKNKKIIMNNNDNNNEDEMKQENQMLNINYQRMLLSLSSLTFLRNKIFFSF